MNAFFEWYMSLNTLSGMLFSVILVSFYYLIKAYSIKLIEKSDNKQVIYKTFSVIRMFIEATISIFAIYVGIVSYQLTNILWISLLSGFLPVLILLIRIMEKKRDSLKNKYNSLIKA